MKKLLFVMTVLVSAACQRVPSEAITEAIQPILSGAPITEAKSRVWADVRKSYEARGNAPIWTSERGTNDAAAKAVAVLQSAGDHGLDPDRYGAADIAQRFSAFSTHKAKASANDLAQFDVRLTTALLAVGRDVAFGVGSPTSIDPQWKPARPDQDLAASLNQAVDAGTVDAWLSSVQPKHAEYAALVKTAHELGDEARAGEWPTVAPGPYKLGARQTAVRSLRQRLSKSGDLPGDRADSDVYDQSVRTAVKSFQEHHGLKATGLADADTIKAMNVPIADRRRQIAANLERWRWEPDDFGQRYFIVNIPALHIDAVENGKVVKSIRVIVGKPDKSTPVLSAKMTEVVFSPYWNIPDSIVAGETAPAVVKDPNYLTKNHMEILRRTSKGVAVVDPADIHWKNPDELKGLAFRQKPGPDNALGHVVFRFPNPYDVYLHDTPADSLFGQRDRALSHGCIRAEEPEELAKYVLRDDPEWPESKIAEAMQAGVEKTVKLQTPIPVHLVYFTAWVDEKGGRHFHPDIYHYDAQIDQTSPLLIAAKSHR